jgi:hypothetical protein
MNSIKRLGFMAILLLLFVTCKKNNNNSNQGDFFAPVYVDFFVNLNLPTYSELQFVNGYVIEPGQGYKGRGIIIYNTGFEGVDKYVAFDRSCPVNVDSSCSYVSVEKSALFYKCGQFNGATFNACCGSRFAANSGVQVEGPAQRGLRKYFVYDMGNQLHVVAAP